MWSVIPCCSNDINMNSYRLRGMCNTWNIYTFVGYNTIQTIKWIFCYSIKYPRACFVLYLKFNKAELLQLEYFFGLLFESETIDSVGNVSFVLCVRFWMGFNFVISFKAIMFWVWAYSLIIRKISLKIQIIQLRIWNSYEQNDNYYINQKIN